MASDSSHFVEISLYYPENVKDVLGMGSGCFIGLVNDTTVMNSDIRGDRRSRSNHPPEGRTGAGLLLEYASHGSLGRYLSSHNPTIQQKITWAKEAAESIAVIHERGVIHCDISVNNLLLDAELNIKLCDFQGRLLGSDRSLKLIGLSSENVKASMPRADPNHADETTDIFALGTAFYHIIEGGEPFPELDSFTQEEDIEQRFISGQFPAVRHAPITAIIHKCWKGEYNSAHKVVSDLELCQLSEAVSIEG